MTNSISLCLVVKNEEQLIGTALGSVKDIVDEMIVVDTGSTDRTISIASQLNARVIRYSWDGSLGRARNAYLEAARGDWILVLDGDESIARKDLPKLTKLLRTRVVIGYQLAIRNYSNNYDLMWDWHANDGKYRDEERFSLCHGWAKTQPLRLFRNFRDVRYVEGSSVHTNPLASLVAHSGRIETRDEVVIHHFQYLKGGGHFLSRKQSLRLDGELRHAKLFPRELQTYLNIAKTLFAERRDAEAVKYLARAARLNGGSHDLYQLWGMIDFENGRLSSADKRLRKAIEINSHSADAWAILGMVLLEGGRHQQAMSALKKAIQLHPDHLLAHNSLGVTYEELGQYRDARLYYRRALRLNPTFAPAAENLGRLVPAKKRRTGNPQ